MASRACSASRRPAWTWPRAWAACPGRRGCRSWDRRRRGSRCRRSCGEPRKQGGKERGKEKEGREQGEGGERRGDPGLLVRVLAVLGRDGLLDLREGRGVQLLRLAAHLLDLVDGPGPVAALLGGADVAGRVEAEAQAGVADELLVQVRVGDDGAGDLGERRAERGVLLVHRQRAVLAVRVHDLLGLR